MPLRAFWLSLLLIICFLPNVAMANERVLRISMWAEAFPEWVFSEFQQETGIKPYTVFFSNEETLYQRMKDFPDSFDLVECSASFVFQHMLQQNLIQPIDNTRFEHEQDINPQIRSKNVDPQMQYLIPHTWGSLLIAVNPQVINPSTIHGFRDLWSPLVDGNLLIPDDLRSIYSFTLLSMGYSPNDNDPEHQSKAADLLYELVNKNTVISTNNLTDLVEGRVGVAVSWNGSILDAINDNPNLEVVIPKEGIILWLDGFFVPSQAKNLDEAYAFLNFIFRPDICARLTKDTMYATTNLQAAKLLPKRITQNPLVYLNSEDAKHAIMEEPMPELIGMENTIWPKLRALAQ